MKKLVLLSMISMLALNLFACSSGDKASSQTRTDLTEDHFSGLTANMKRSDVEDLVGKHDSSLSDRETLEVYSLSDGRTAILRYVDDSLVGAFIRGADNLEDTIFNGLDRLGHDLTDDEKENLQDTIEAGDPENQSESNTNGSDNASGDNGNTNDTSGNTDTNNTGNTNTTGNTTNNDGDYNTNNGNVENTNESLKNQ